MKKYRKLWENVPSRSGGGDPIPKPTPQPISQPTPTPLAPINMKLDDLPWDPSDRPIIYSYDPNIVEEIRRMYWDRGPCQPKGHKFPTKLVGAKKRCFVVTWFNEFRWLEYSVKKTKHIVCVVICLEIMVRVMLLRYRGLIVGVKKQV